MPQTPRQILHALALARPAVLHMHRTWREAGESYRFSDLVAGALIVHGYPGRMRLAGREFSLEPGSLSLIPCGTERVFLPGAAGWHRVVNFAPDAFDRIMVSHVDLSYAQICRDFDECLARYAVERSRAEVKIWDLLWSLRDSIDWTFPDADLPPLIAEAVKQIEWNLSAAFPIRDLADRLGVSAGHLSRRFRRAMGEAPAAYQRRRRMLLARQLLENTDQSVKEIASACGLPDAQWFNKAVRRAFGRSPTELRRDFQSRLPAGN